MGRPALKGKRRPKLNAVLADRKTVWTSVTLTEWYGGQTSASFGSTSPEIPPSGHHNGMPPAAIRWVLVCAIRPANVDAQAFLCTDLDLELNARAILQRFSVCALADRGQPSKKAYDSIWASRDAAAMVGPGPSCARHRRYLDSTRW